jgi:hypothetical protein
MGDIYGFTAAFLLARGKIYTASAGYARLVSPTERLILESHGEHIDGPGR